MKEKQKAYKKISSYIATLILPLFIIVPLYFFINATLEKEIEQSNNSLLNTLKVGMDAYVQGAESALDELSSDINLLNMTDSFEFIEADVENVKAKLKTICREYFYIKDAYILFGSRDCIVSQDGITDIKKYLEDEKGLNSEEYFRYRKTLGRKYKNEFLKSSEGISQNGVLTSICSVPFDNVGILKAQIIVEINITEIIKSMNVAKPYSIFVKDKDKLNVYSDGNAEVNSLIPGVIKNGVYGENEKYYISSTEAGFNNLMYFLAVKLDEYIRPLMYLRYAMVAIYLICILLILLSIKRFFDLQHNSITKVLELFEKNSGDEHSYEDLYVKVNSLIAEKEKLDIEIVKKVYIRSLLNGKSVSMQKFEKYFDKDKEHVIISVITDNCSNLYSDSSDDMTELEKFQEAQIIAENVLTEYLSEAYLVLSVDMDDTIAFIVEGDKISEYIIENKMMNANEKIKTFFRFSLRYGIARVENKQYFQAYQAANNSVPKIKEDYFAEKNLYFYPPEAEERIITQIKHKSYLEAKTEIKKIIDTNFEEAASSEEFRKLFHMSIANTIVRVIWELDLVQYKQLHKRIPEILNIKDSNLFFDEISSFIDEIENCFIYENDTDAGFKKKVSEYIDENYNDKNINLDILGDYMQMNPSYLSRKFKNQFGMGVLEYIYKIRIDAAKIQLANNKRIVETADAVGFATERSFVRAFTKYVGVTPAQYRKNIIE